MLLSSSCCSVTKSCLTLCTPMDCSRPPCPSPSPGVCSSSCSFSRPLILLPSVLPSIRLFSNDLALHIRWPKYWSFSFSISPCNEYSGLISFRMDWFDLLAVQGTLKSLLQHSSKASILCCSAFFMVQLSHPYMTTGKTIALTIWTFVSKVMSLLFNIVSSFVSFSSKEQASFNFMAAVTVHSDFVAKEKKVCHCFHCFPIYLP